MKAVIFDCDGVLVESESIYQKTELKLLTELGLDVDPFAYAERFMGLPTKIYFQNLRETYEPVLGHALPDDFETRFRAQCHHEIETSLVAMDGIADYIAALKLPYAVASSTGLEFLHRKLHLTNLHASFDPHIYSGEQVPRGKPYPDLFLFTAKKLNVAPEDCLVIEDSVNGVKAGVAAGMPVIGFCGGGHCSPRHAAILKAAGAFRTILHFRELA